MGRRNLQLDRALPVMTERDHVAAAHLAVDGQIEHGEIARSALDHQVSSD
jgi:hypothetical protein